MHATVDHLLYGCSELELGTDEIERLTGVRPRYGGQHLGLGTHNALLSLGERTYLEVIAPDPSQPDASPPPYGIASLRAPALRAWAAAPDRIEAAVRDARAAGAAYTEVTTHTRRAPGGEEVRWRMSTLPDEGDRLAILPFLIDWGATIHPAERAPKGVRLVRFHVLSPEPALLQRTLGAIGADVAVLASETPGLEALLVGPSGREALLRS